MNTYGKEVILDLQGCPSPFTRAQIARYMEELCDKIDMERCELYWWDDEGLPEDEKEIEPHLDGISAVQFIMTSNVTIHTLHQLNKVFLNIFSCKDFNKEDVEAMSLKHFGGVVAQSVEVERL